MATGLLRRIVVARRREAVRSGLGVDEVDVAILDAEEARAAADVGVADEHVGWHARISGTTSVRHDRADGRIGRVAADHAAGMHKVRGKSVLIDDLMVHRTHGSDMLHELGRAREVLAQAYARDGGLDGRVERATFLGCGLVVAEHLRVEGVDLAHAAAQPDEDAMLGLAFWARGFGRRQER